MNVKKQLKDAQECIDNNSKDNAELLKLKVGLASTPRRVLPMLPVTSPRAASGGSNLATGGSPGGSHVSTGQQASVYSKARLPKIEMKRFNGDICHWQ